MKKLLLGCAVAGLIVLLPKAEAGPPLCMAHSLMILQTPKAEVGVASWYGIERQGEPTTSGELFDKNLLTAAHPWLPLGSLVRVTNLANFRSALLRINDRGPAFGSRVIDVSWAAARQLHFVGEGLTRVEIQVVQCDLPILR